MKVNLIDYDDLGNAIARINDKVCFVLKGLKGEVVDIYVYDDKKSYSKAIIKKIEKKHKLRIKPICPYYNECGGCQFLHCKEELEKEFLINKCIKFIGSCDDFLETNSLNYRNKVIFHVKDGNIGFYSKNSNALVKISYCHLISDKMNKVLDLLNKFKDKTFNGSIMIRENFVGEIILVINGNYCYIDNLIKEDIITNLVLNDKVLKGNNYFIENILDYKFKVSYKSFFQVNRLGLENIFNIISKFLENKNINKALDLYSGCSVLGIHLSKYAKKVISVEENKYASLDAKYNLSLNNITNLEVVNGLVEDYIDKFSDIDLIILDPARRGLDKKTISYLRSIKSKYIIYISCKMDSLKRDLKELDDIYQKEFVYLVDMFKRTGEVETVAFLKLKKKIDNELRK